MSVLAAAAVAAAHLLLPGALLTLRLRDRIAPRLDAILLGPLSLALSLAYFIPIFVVAYLLECPVPLLEAAWVLGVAALVADRFRGRRRIAPRIPICADGPAWALALGGGAVLAALVAWGPEMHVDSFASIAGLRKLAASPTVRFVDPYFADAGPDPIYGLDAWHALLAMIVRLSPLDPIVTFQWVTVLCAALILLSVFHLTRSVLPDGVVAAGAFAAFLSIHAILEGNWIFSLAAFHMEVAAFLLLPLYLAFLVAEEPAARRGAVVVGAVLPFVHPMGLALALVATFGLAAIDGLLGRPAWRSVACVGAGVLALSAPTIIAKCALGSAVSAAATTPFSFRFLGGTAWGFFEPGVLLEPDYVRRLGSENAWLFVSAYAAAFACLPLVRTSAAARLAFASAALPPLLLLNPLATRVLAPLMSHLLARRFSMLPLVWLLLATPILLLRSVTARRVAVGALPLFLLAAALGVGRLHVRDFAAHAPVWGRFEIEPDRLRHVGVWAERYRGYRIPLAALERLRGERLPGPTLACENLTALYAAAWTDLFALFTFPECSGPAFPPERLREREEEHRAFLSGALSESDLAGLVRRRGIGGFLVATDSTRARAILEASPRVYRSWEEGGWILYRVLTAAEQRE